MEKLFYEKDIREELERLDKFTGLKGATLPIKFGNATMTLGRFYGEKNNMRFYFSNHFFLNPDFPVEEKIDVIRHEYAHYMDYVIYGVLGHGVTWKMCCDKIGASPVRLYREEVAAQYLLRHEEENKKNKELDKITQGTIIHHPQYGDGIIKKITGEGTERIAQVYFNKIDTNKYLSLSWINSNIPA